MKPPVIAGALQWRGQGVDPYTLRPHHTEDCDYFQTKGARICDCGVWSLMYMDSWAYQSTRVKK